MTNARPSIILSSLAIANSIFEHQLAIANGGVLKKWMAIDMTLKNAVEGKEYIIQRIETDDEELDSFLFSLGCYSGEAITVVSHLKSSCVVSIKDGRYNMDHQLAQAIVI